MVSIFYNKLMLNDTMVISVSSNVPDRNVRTEFGTLLYNGDEFVGINFFDVSKYIDLEEGYLFLTKKIDTVIQEKFNVDLKKYHSPKFVVGQIIELEQIPNTHLTKCIVDINREKLQVVCGGTNLSQGIKVVVAMAKVVMPSGKVLIPSKLMGIESNGMICSKKEIFKNIQNPDPDGHIMILDDNYNIGDEFVEHYSNYKK